jgi:hypothetical protein
VIQDRMVGLAVESFWRSSHTVLPRTFDADALQRATQNVTRQDQGYGFQHPAVLQNVPPPTVKFRRPLRWWSLDRRRRLATAMRLRDRLLQDIMRAGREAF